MRKLYDVRPQTIKSVFFSYEKTGILTAVVSLEKYFGVAMSNMNRALARFSAFFLFYRLGH